MQIKAQYINSKRVLIFNPSFIGDAVLTTPLVHAVQKLLPAAEVDLCVRPESAPLFKHLNVVIYDKRRSAKGIRGALRFAKMLQEAEYDIIISPHKSLRSTLTVKMAGKLRIGYKEAVLSGMYTHSVSRDMSMHEVERVLSLLEPITDNYSIEAAKELGGKPSSYLDEKYYNNIKEYFSITSGDKPVVGLSPGSVWGTKRWPSEYFIELAKMLHNEGYALAVSGGPGDISETDDVLASGLPMYDFANKIPFELLPSVIANLAVLVSNDSSPLHIAVSQDVPTVAIFGATVPSLGFYPYDDTSIICENKALDCRPCGLHGKMECPKKHFKCMLDLSPQQVFSAVQKILNRGK